MNYGNMWFPSAVLAWGLLKGIPLSRECPGTEFFIRLNCSLKESLPQSSSTGIPLSGGGSGRGFLSRTKYFLRNACLRAPLKGFLFLEEVHREDSSSRYMMSLRNPWLIAPLKGFLSLCARFRERIYYRNIWLSQGILASELLKEIPVLGGGSQKERLFQ